METKILVVTGSLLRVSFYIVFPRWCPTDSTYGAFVGAT